MFEELEDLFAQVESTAGQFEELPEGDYLAVIEGAEYKESKKGRPMVQIMCKVSAGTYEGRLHSKFMMLDGHDTAQVKRNMTMFASQVKSLGIDTSGGFQKTLDLLGTLEDTEVTLNITKSIGKNGREYTNTRINLADE